MPELPIQTWCFAVVVVRLGHSDSEQIPREVQELADIVELYPGR